MPIKKYIKPILRALIPLALAAILLCLVFVWGNVAVRKQLPLLFEEEVESSSQEFGLDKYLVWAVIKTESNFREDAKSSAGACGLMQLMPDTAQWIADKYHIPYEEGDLFVASSNIRLGCCYLSYLYEKFQSVDLAVAAYNGGEGNVHNWLENPSYSDDGKTLKQIPYKETANYLNKVTTRYELYQKLYA